MRAGAGFVRRMADRDTTREYVIRLEPYFAGLVRSLTVFDGLSS